MNKLFRKIGMAFVGIAMAVGVGVSISSNAKKITPTFAASTTATWAMSKANKLSETSGNFNDSQGNSWSWESNQSAGSLQDNDTCQQIGAKGSPATVSFSTSDISGTITSVTVECASYQAKHNVSITVGGVAYLAATATPSWTTVGSKSGTGSSSGEIVISFTPQSGARAMYIKSISVTYGVPEFGTLDHIVISTQADKKDFDVGETFSKTGLTLTAYDGENEGTANSKTITSGFTTDYDGHTFVDGDIGAEKTVTVSYTESAVTKTATYSISVWEAPVVKFDKDNTPFTSSTNSNTSTETNTIGGIEYKNYAGYNYTNYLSFNRNVNGYLGNNTAFAKNIKAVVIDINSGGASYFTMYEGASALPEATIVNPSSSGNGRIVYTFSDSNQFFKLKLTTTGTFQNINYIKVYLGSVPVAAEVSSVEIATPGSVYVGKTLQLSATVHYTNKADDNKVTWAIKSGSGATINESSGLLTAIDNVATVVTATSIERDGSDQNVVAEVTVTPLANPIVSVAWNTSAAKKEYNIGDALDISGVVATGTNAAGDDDVAITLTAENFSGFDSSEAVNSQTITVTYLTFSTTYNISVVAAPDVYITSSDFAAGGYSVNDAGIEVNGIAFDVKDSYQSGGIQMKASSGQFHNTYPLGSYITSIEVKVKTNSVTVYLGTKELTSNSGSQSVTVSSGNATTITPDSNTYQYVRFGNGGTYDVVEYIKIWYAPFVPTVSLGETTSFTFDQGDAGNISVTATAAHYTNNSGVVFTATSSDQEVLANANIGVDGSTITISKANINPGVVTVTVTGTYSAASEVASATLTITCNAAVRNLQSIAITTASEDINFTEGDKFTITGLAITGTFDAAPLTADVTSECVFKLWNGSAESALTPGTTTLGTPGDFTIRISHASSAAAETLTYSIHVSEIPKFSAVDFNDLYEGAEVLIVNADNKVAVGNYGSSIYGCEHVTFDGEGKITDWGKALVFTVRIYGERVAFEYGTNKYLGYNGSGNAAHEQSELSGNDKTSWTFDNEHGLLSATNGRYLQYNATSPRFACYTGGQNDVSIYISSNSNKTDALAADTFAYRYLHMRDYLGTEGQAGSNYCLGTGEGAGKNYFNDAATAYASLNTDAKAEFKKNTEAVKRFNAWAEANHKSIDLDTGNVSSAGAYQVGFSGTQLESNLPLIITLISAGTIAAVGSIFLFSRRRRNEE